MMRKFCDECDEMVMPVLKDNGWYECPICHSKLDELEKR